MWSSKKRGKNWTGSYERDKRGERVFVLSRGSHYVTFESWQAAKQAGWIKK